VEENTVVSSAQNDPVSSIWGQISGWPPPLRLSLASKILQSLEHEQSRPRKSLADLWGLMATEQPPPTDEEVNRILEEHRLRKYG
jgi:hypothetical protein